MLLLFFFARCVVLDKIDQFSSAHQGFQVERTPAPYQGLCLLLGHATDLTTA
jgi:hypothetical protein